MDTASIGRRARAARFGRAVLWLVTGVFYVIGWLARKLWVCVAWAGYAIADGWTGGAGPRKAGPDNM